MTHPAGSLKGGADPHSRRRTMYALVALQAAFCCLVLFLSGLLVATFGRLSHRPLGFSAERLVNLETVAEEAQPESSWGLVAAHLRAVPGVESVAISGFPLMQGNAWNGFVSVDGAPPGPVLAYFLNVSPGWVDTMKLGWVTGMDLRPNDTSPGVAIVNETFVKEFLGGRNPIGVPFRKGQDPYRIVAVVRDAPYRNFRDPILPAAYVPFRSVYPNGVEAPRNFGTFVVRTRTSDPIALASLLRREVGRARPGFRVSNIRTQQEILDGHTIRERLLAMLALFFAVVAVVLAGVGMYGVLDYSVLQRRREIGIRVAIGAPATDIARRVIAATLCMVVTGGAAGLAMGVASARWIERLLFQVRITEPAMLTVPALTILSAALLAAVPAVIRAIRLDPVKMLRVE